MQTHEEWMQDLLKDKNFREAYLTYDIDLEMSIIVEDARLAKNLTQAQLAKKMGTTQSSIARVENGHLPSLSFLKRMGEALGTFLFAPRFAFQVESDPEYEVNILSEYKDIKEQYSDKKKNTFLNNTIKYVIESKVDNNDMTVFVPSENLRSLGYVRANSNLRYY